MNTVIFGFLIGLALVLVIWFVFVAPSERRMHERQMAQMKRRLERNEERVRQERAAGLGESGYDEPD